MRRLLVCCICSCLFLSGCGSADAPTPVPNEHVVVEDKSDVTKEIDMSTQITMKGFDGDDYTVECVTEDSATASITDDVYMGVTGRTYEVMWAKDKDANVVENGVFSFANGTCNGLDFEGIVTKDDSYRILLTDDVDKPNFTLGLEYKSGNLPEKWIDDIKALFIYKDGTKRPKASYKDETMRVSSGPAVMADATVVAANLEIDKSLGVLEKYTDMTGKSLKIPEGNYVVQEITPMGDILNKSKMFIACARCVSTSDIPEEAETYEVEKLTWKCCLNEGNVGVAYLVDDDSEYTVKVVDMQESGDLESLYRILDVIRVVNKK